MHKRVSPGEGGCWFCYRKDDTLLFDFEFDTYVHRICIERELNSDPVHPEARLMRYLLKDGDES